MGANIFEIDKIDISKIDSNEVFGVDTNILYWCHYTKASSPNLNCHSYQVLEYPKFIGQLINNGNRLVTTSLNLSELCHVVENSEWKIYNTLNSRMQKKDFRNLPTERIKYQKELNNIFLQIKSFYEENILEISLSQDSMNFFISGLNQNSCDFFDIITLEKLKEKGIHNIITDDKDFQSIDNINLYTIYKP